MKHFRIIFIVFALVWGGCALFQTKEEQSAAELAKDGMADFEKGKYRNAIRSFEKIRDWYPFSRYSILAELKLADAYFELGEYDEAVLAYEQFENLHPRNDAAPYVIYRIGKSHFLRIRSPDRDQRFALLALRAFDRLSVQFPESPYTRKARAHIHECLKSLAENEFYIGLFYFKAKHYEAALHRFKAIVREYPDAGVHHGVLEYIALCHAELNRRKTAPAEQ